MPSLEQEGKPMKLESLKQLKELDAALEKATEGNRGLDCRLHVILFGWKLSRVGADYDGKNAGEVWTENGKPPEGFSYPPRGLIDPYYHAQIAPRYTASLDAADALRREVLPGSEYEITTLYGHARVDLPINSDDFVSVRREDGNVPLAYVRAIVAAKIKEGENG